LQAAEKASECFEYLSMNEIFSIISNLSPFVLSLSKDDRRVFQQPARLDPIWGETITVTEVFDGVPPKAKDGVTNMNDLGLCACG